MFNARYLKTQEIMQVLDTYLEPNLAITYFLVWHNNDWRWYPADSFVPPIYNRKEKSNG